MMSDYLNSHPGLNRNEITRIVYGVTRKEKLIEYISSRFINRKFKKIDKDIRILLLIGIFLIQFSDSYPDYAVVNEIVGLTSDKRAGGFLNAVLRKISREHEEINKIINNIEDPMIKYSISEEIYYNLDLITSDIDGTLEYLDSEPVFHVRINKKDIDPEKVKESFTKNNIPYKIINQTGLFEIENAGQVVRTILPEHEIYFQNTGSFAVSAVTSSFAGESILDCCAAPGTKTLTLSQLCPESQIVASDINPNRLKLIIPYINNSGRQNIELVTGDICSPPVKNVFNTVLIDAPCSSSGTLRKNPDLKSKINHENIERNSIRQMEILKSVMSWVNPGTTIIYAVCSFIQNETEIVLKDSIGNFRSDEFEILEAGNILQKFNFRSKKGEFGIFLLPDGELNNDLFYISVIRKK